MQMSWWPTLKSHPSLPFLRFSRRPVGLGRRGARFHGNRLPGSPAPRLPAAHCCHDGRARRSAFSKRIFQKNLPKESFKRIFQKNRGRKTAGKNKTEGGDSDNRRRGKKSRNNPMRRTRQRHRGAAEEIRDQARKYNNSGNKTMGQRLPWRLARPSIT